MRRASIVLVLVAACGKSAPTTSAGSGSAPPPPQSPVGTTPHLFGALEGLSIGAAKTDVVARIPELVAVDGPHPQPYTGEGWIDHKLEYFAAKKDGLEYRVLFSDGVLTKTTIDIAIKRDELLQSWGASVMKRSMGTRIFLDKKTHVRALLADENVTPLSITLEAYVPLESILDKDPTVLFGQPVVGIPVDDVIRHITPHSVERSDWTFDLPPTEYADETALLTLSTDENDVVTSWLLDKTAFRPSPEMSSALTAFSTSLWGAPTPKEPRLEYTVGANRVIVDPRFGSFSENAKE
jgi:hypothetical protein